MRDISISDRRNSSHQSKKKSSIKQRQKQQQPAAFARKAKSDWDRKGVTATSRNTRIIAYGADGSVIRFDSLAEAAEFFELKRVDTLRRYIDNSWPMPDGTTFCDYL